MWKIFVFFCSTFVMSSIAAISDTVTKIKIYIDHIFLTL